MGTRLSCSIGIIASRAAKTPLDRAMQRYRQIGFLDIVRVQLLIQLKLLAAILIAACIVQREPALPGVKSCAGIERDRAIEIRDRLLDSAGLEMLLAATIVRVGRIELDRLREQQRADRATGSASIASSR